MNEAMYMFKIFLPKRQVFESKKYPESNYKQFIYDCELKCKALHANADNVKIVCYSEYGGTFTRNPELGEIMAQMLKP